MKKSLNFLNKMLIIVTLMLLIFMFSGIFNVTAYAATYSSKFISIVIPNKYEKYYESTDEESEWVSYSYSSNTEYTTVHYDIYSRYGSTVVYTQSHLDDLASDLQSTYEEDYNIKFLHKEIIENNGCKGMRIAYKAYNIETTYSYYRDYYYFLTDNYKVELSFGSDKASFIDSQEEKSIVNSLKIKDTVSKSRGIPFTDVASDSWYIDAVKYVYNNDMIKGINDYTYSPNANLTRGMLVTVLWRMEGNPKASTNQFTDVKSSQYYYNAVNWAASKKIVNGYGNGKFGPNDNITREQLAVMLKNYAQYKKKNVSARADLTKFTDNKKITSTLKDGVSWAVAKNIISGKSNGTKVDPQGKATRAEAAAMLRSYCLNVK